MPSVCRPAWRDRLRFHSRFTLCDFDPTAAEGYEEFLGEIDISATKMSPWIGCFGPKIHKKVLMFFTSNLLTFPKVFPLRASNANNWTQVKVIDFLSRMMKQHLLTYGIVSVLPV